MLWCCQFTLNADGEREAMYAFLNLDAKEQAKWKMRYYSAAVRARSSGQCDGAVTDSPCVFCVQFRFLAGPDNLQEIYDAAKKTMEEDDDRKQNMTKSTFAKQLPHYLCRDLRERLRSTPLIQALARHNLRANNRETVYDSFYGDATAKKLVLGLMAAGTPAPNWADRHNRSKTPTTVWCNSKPVSGRRGI